MTKIEYANACSEVIEILKYVSIEDCNKIPKSKINLFIDNSNKTYQFNYDPLKTLEEQNVSKIAKGIIAILFRDYWVTELQKQKIIAKMKYDELVSEQAKLKKYNPDDIFENRKIKIIPKENSLINVKANKWYDKIATILKKI